MSYRDPKFTMKQDVITAGIQNMLQVVAANTAAAKKAEDAKIARYDKYKEKSYDKYDIAYNKAKGQLDKFTGGMRDEKGERTAESNSIDAQIQAILEDKGAELEQKIEEIQARNGSAAEIRAATRESVSWMETKFTPAITNYILMQDEFKEAKQNEAGEPNSLISNGANQRNVGALNMLQSLHDGTQGEVQIALMPGGEISIATGDFDDDNNFVAAEVVNLSDPALKDGGPKGSFFETTELFDKGDYSVGEDAFKALADNKDLQILDDKGNPTGKLDKTKAIDYLVNDATGRTMVNGLLADGQAINRWGSLVDAESNLIDGPDWEGAWDNYSDNNYLNLVLDNAWDDLYMPGIVAAEEDIAKKKQDKLDDEARQDRRREARQTKADEKQAKAKRENAEREENKKLGKGAYTNAELEENAASLNTGKEEEKKKGPKLDKIDAAYRKGVDKINKMKNVSQKDKDKALKDLEKIRRDNLRKLG
jgi:hypothetical protein